MSCFEEQLNRGLLGESEIARYFIGRGFQVLPAYQVEIGSGKGPRLFGKYGQLVSPDMLVFNAEKVLWIEAKTKSAFTWHRISGTWQTGIDLRHWNEYLKVNEETPFPVWLLFLHRPGFKAKDTPDGLVSPTGLFGNEITRLRDCVDHVSDRHGRTGMVYWKCESLKRISD